jgi:NAD(P)-dependent dehydrogenase (short-subunit alcohol dehydrogenase family)
VADQSQTRVAWVTGGSTGIGYAIARSLVQAGYLVVISARNDEGLRAACSDLEKAGGKAEFVVMDVARRSEVEQACRSILDRHGRIDVLVNNAGFNVRARKWEDLIPEEFDAVIAANLSGTFYTIHAVLPSMRANGGGMIFNIASMAGKQVSLDGGVAYTAAKHGVFVMSQLLNQSELKHGIRTCVVAPGGVDTRAHDWRPGIEELRTRMLKPEDVARAVRFALETPAHAAIFEIDIVAAPPRG